MTHWKAVLCGKTQRMGRWAGRTWYWFVLSLAMLGGIVYSMHRAGNQAYFDGAIGNGLAILLGVIAGVPIALALERRRAAQEALYRAAEQRDRAANVSRLIRDELAHNGERLAQRHHDPTVLPVDPFKNALWRALSDSGEIRWIDDPSLLNEIASAYHYIGVVAAIEDKCYQALRGFDLTYGDGTRASQRLLRDARFYDAHVQLAESISAAIAAVDEAMGDGGTS